MKTRPGEIWLADLGLAAKTRPVVILSRIDENPPRQLVVYVPLTTQNRGSAYEVNLGAVSCLYQPSVANVQGIGALALTRLERRLGVLHVADMDRIKAALRFALEL